jgi:hypothetical protein
LSARHIPESSDPTATRGVDALGGSLAVIALAGINFGLIEASTLGWSGAAVVAILAFGVVGSVIFVLVERSSDAPLLPLDVFRVCQFTVTNVVTFVVHGALGGTHFLLPVQLQVVDGYSPIESGVAFLPLTLVMPLLSARSGCFAGRIRPRLQIGVGPMVVGGGLALLARTASDSSYVTGVLPAVLVFGLQLAIAITPLTATALGGVVAALWIRIPVNGPAGTPARPGTREAVESLRCALDAAPLVADG